MDDLVATCEQKASDFESRQQLRTEEIMAVKKAFETISIDKVKGNDDEHLAVRLAQTASASPPASQLHAWHEWSAT